MNLGECEAGGRGGLRMIKGRGAIFALLALLVLFIAPASASAALPEHKLLEVFGSANKPTFVPAQGLAVDQSNGDLLVINRGSGTLSRWKPDGTPNNFTCTPGPNCTISSGNEITGFSFSSANESEVAVDNSGGATDGNIYVATNIPNRVDIFSEDGTHVGQLTQYKEGGNPPSGPLTGYGYTCGVAVDPSGNVYVGDAENGVNPGVHKYEPSGSVPVNGDNTLNIPTSEVAEPCGIAAGVGPSAGSIFVAGFSNTITKFNSTTGAKDYVVTSAGAEAVNVDPSSGHLYAAIGFGNKELLEFDASGPSVGDVKEISKTPVAHTPLGVAINGTTGNVYVSSEEEENKKIDVFAPLESELTITETGTGAGSVKCKFDGGGLEACDGLHRNGTSVEVVATPGLNSELGSVSGTGSAAGCTTSPCTFVLEADSSVTVEFKAEANKVKLERLFSGTGTGEIKCDGGACQTLYNKDQVVALDAVPTGGHSQFTGWSVTGSGSVTTPCTGTTNPCEVKMEEPGPVVATATFNLEKFALTVTKSGTGTGTVESTPAGINCGATCSAEFNFGTKVKLKGTPGPNAQSVVWTGCDAVNGPNECEVEMTAAKGVTAKFDLVKFALTVTKSGTGTGTVESTPAGINCGATCSAEFDSGTLLKLKGTPALHGKQVEWTGCDAVNGSNECEVTMSSAKGVTAKFDLITHTLTVTKVGKGSSTVTCKEDAGTFGLCSIPFKEGHQVTVRTVAAPGSVFVEYKGGTGSSGACNAVKTTECTFTIEADSSLESQSDKVARAFTATTKGNGAGTVECKVGVAFGPCGPSYEDGSEVTVKATASLHNSLAPFSAGEGSATTCTTKTGECKFTIKADSSLTVTFEKITHTLSVSLAGTGFGSVTCNGGACASSYDEGTSVTLAATANSGSTFAGFSGGCSGTSCTVTMGANTAVTATFNTNPPPLVECKVPKVKGLSLGKAKSAITKANCKVGAIRKPKAKKGKKLGPLVVKSSSPAAGAVRAEGTKVSLTLGPKPKKR